MEHIDPEALALVALGEPVANPQVVDHLTQCKSCRHEGDALQSTVSIARSSIGEAELHAPPARVWQSVRAELGLSADLPPVAPGRPQIVRAPIRPSLVARLDVARGRRSSIQRLVVPIAASAAAAALVAGGVLWWGAAAPRDSGQLIASVQLDALPDWPAATGQATVAERADGERVVQVSLNADVGDGVVREVWLLTEDVEGLISLGLLTGASGEFVVPSSVDLARFSIVDISAEPLDGDPTHSGDSIARGAFDA